MKKSVAFMAIATLITSSIIMSCSSPAEKVAEAQNNVVVANNNLDSANKEYMADIENYKKEESDKISANEKSIADFRARIAKEKSVAKEEYNKKLDDLEKKNSDMKKSLDEYKADGKDKWQTFKADFNKSMEGLGNSFKDLTKKN